MLALGFFLIWNYENSRLERGKNTLVFSPKEKVRVEVRRGGQNNKV